MATKYLILTDTSGIKNLTLPGDWPGSGVACAIGGGQKGTTPNPLFGVSGSAGNAGAMVWQNVTGTAGDILTYRIGARQAYDATPTTMIKGPSSDFDYYASFAASGVACTWAAGNPTWLKSPTGDYIVLANGGGISNGSGFLITAPTKSTDWYGFQLFYLGRKNDPAILRGYYIYTTPLQGGYQSPAGVPCGPGPSGNSAGMFAQGLAGQANAMPLPYYASYITANSQIASDGYDGANARYDTNQIYAGTGGAPGTLLGSPDGGDGSMGVYFDDGAGHHAGPGGGGGSGIGAVLYFYTTADNLPLASHWDAVKSASAVYGATKGGNGGNGGQYGGGGGAGANGTGLTNADVGHGGWGEQGVLVLVYETSAPAVSDAFTYTEIWGADAPASPSPPVYVPKAVHFGAGVHLDCTSLSCTDNGTFSISVWFKDPQGTGGLPNPVYNSDLSGANANYFYLGNNSNFHTENVLQVADYSAEQDSRTDRPNDADWHHFLLTSDTSGVGHVQTRIDGALATPFDVFDQSPFSFVLNGLSMRIGDDGANTLVADICDLWIAPGVSLFDGGFNIPDATVELFIKDGEPQDPADFPSGGSVLFSGDASTFATNQLSGGTFTLTGSLTTATAP